MPRRIAIAAFLLSSLFALPAGRADEPTCADPERTLVMDAVELSAGREVAGNAALCVTSEGITYYFSTAKNKAEFERMPERYEVVDGGACGRMGPLSGLGDARRFAVHQGRIYFFASDACREGFLKAPEKCIETDASMLRATVDQEQRGKAVLDEALKRAGGQGAIVGVSSYRQTESKSVDSGGRTWKVVKKLAMEHTHQFAQHESWDDHWFSTIRNRDGAAMASNNKHESIGYSRWRAFDREMSRNAIVMLKRYVEFRAVSAPPGFHVRYDGDNSIGETPVSNVTVWIDGALTHWAVERKTGRLVQMSFRGRDGTSSIGDVVRTFTEYKTVDGVHLPTAYTVTFDGKPLASAAVTLDGFEINPKLDAKMFAINKPD